MIDEFANSSVLQGIDPKRLLNNLSSIYLQMGDKLIRALIAGQLPLAMQQDADLRTQIGRLQEGSFLPGIYGQYIADKDGFGPTGSELLEWIDAVEDYIEEDHDTVRKTDQAALRPGRHKKYIRLRHMRCFGYCVQPSSYHWISLPMMMIMMMMIQAQALGIKDEAAAVSA